MEGVTLVIRGGKDGRPRSEGGRRYKQIRGVERRMEGARSRGARSGHLAIGIVLLETTVTRGSKERRTAL